MTYHTVCHLDTGVGIYRFTVCRRLGANGFGLVVNWPDRNGRVKLCQSKVPSLYLVGQHGNNDSRCLRSQDRDDVVRHVAAEGSAGRRRRNPVKPRPPRRRPSSMVNIAE